MTLFEYLSVAVSIVLSLGVAHLLANARGVFASRTRYWAVGSLWAQLLLLHALIWWVLWSFRAAPWDFGRFLFVLTVAATLFVSATTLVPRSRAVAGWREHYYLVHHWIFGGLVVLLVQIAAMLWILGGPFILSPRRPLFLAWGATSVAGLVSSNPKVHVAVAVLSWALLVGLSIDQLLPGRALPA